MRRLWAVLLVMALFAVACAGDDVNSDIFAASDDIATPEQADDGSAGSDEAEVDDEPQAAVESDEPDADEASDGPFSAEVSNDLQGFVEQFFAARDAYFIEGRDPLIDEIATPAVIGVLDAEREDNLNSLFEADVLTFQQSEPLDVIVEEVGGQSLVRTCVEQEVLDSDEGRTRWQIAEVAVSGEPGSFTVDGFDVIHDGGQFSGLGCVPDYARERALAVVTEWELVSRAAVEDPRSFDAALLEPFLAGEFLAEQSISVGPDVEIFSTSPIEAQFVVTGSDASFPGETIRVSVCRRFPEGVLFTNYDGVSQGIPEDLGPGSSLGANLVFLLGDEPSDDRLTEEINSGFNCWDAQ